MRITLRASTGAKISVWREDDLFHARLDDDHGEPQICMAIDLFEVIADLAGLDLDGNSHAAEAIALSGRAQRELGWGIGPDGEEPR